MTDLHVVYGTGPIGAALIDELLKRGHSVRAVNRSGADPLPASVAQLAGNASDPAFAARAAEGAVALYQCMSPAYSKWRDHFPPLQRAIATAAHDTGARLVSMENVYMYGDTDGAPITEDLPYAAKTRKGRIRAIMAEELAGMAAAGYIRLATARASDYFGPRAQYQSVFGTRVIIPAFTGGSAKAMGNPNLPHSYAYTGDIARALATLGTDDRALGEVWHVPNAPAMTTAEIVELIRLTVGRERLPLLTASRGVLWAAGLLNANARELVEMLYQFEKPFIVDGSKFERIFGFGATPIPQAIIETIKWWRGPAPEQSPPAAV